MKKKKYELPKKYRDLSLSQKIELIKKATDLEEVRELAINFGRMLKSERDILKGVQADLKRAEKKLNARSLGKL